MTAPTFKIYEGKDIAQGWTEGDSVMEIPDTPVKKTQRQRFTVEEEYSSVMDVDENVEDCSGLTDTNLDSVGLFDLNNEPVAEEWDTEDQFANGYTAALLQREDCERENEEALAFNLLSSQSSSDTVIPSSQSSSDTAILESSNCGYGSIEDSFMPVPSQPPETMSQYNLKNQELVDSKYCIGIRKRKLHDAILQRSRKKFKRPNKKVYRPKVVRNLGRPIPRMEPKTPTKKIRKLKLKKPKEKKNVPLKESSSTIDLNHAPIIVDLEPSVLETEISSVDIEKDGTSIVSNMAVECCLSDKGLNFLKKKKRTTMGKKWELKDYCRIMEPRNIQKKKRMGRKCWGVEKKQKIVTEFGANYLPRRYRKKRRAAPVISLKELQKIFYTANQLSPCLFSQSRDLNIEESLMGIVSLLESDSFELLVKSNDAFEENISHESNHGILVCYQENEKHGHHDELGIVAHENGELGMVATTKKKGSRQEKLDKLEHGELSHPWKLQLLNEVKEGDKHDQQQSEFWKKERDFFYGRFDLFLTRMRIVQGNRKFSQWGGSVVDSIIGVFLTQNVSDHLSSSAFLSLAATFPCQPSCNRELTHANPRPRCEQSKIVNIEEYVEDEISKLSCEPSNDQTYGEDINTASSTSALLLFDKETMESENQQISNSEMVLSSTCEVEDHGRSNQEVELHKDYYVNMPSDGSECTRDIITNNSQSFFNEVKQKGKKLKADERNNIEGAMVIGKLDWDYHKRRIETERGERREINHMDSIDWQAVRLADVDDIAEAIKGRGQHRIIAGRIKKFLNEVNQDHREINLEWLRWAPAELVRTYLTNIEGIGLKSVECVRLLALKQIAFPVDVNVGRIAIRLGWVPMQPLPEDVQIHVLEEMPVMDNIQKYLWPRLNKLSFEELYELHYQMITFGKVFCTKRKPNCRSCPMKNECKHYLSAYASTKHAALPKATGKQRQEKQDENHEIVCGDHLSFRYEPLYPASHSYLENNTKLEYKMRGCEPIIEEPASPGRPSPTPDYVERDIEDLFIDNPLEKYVTRDPYINAFGGSDTSSFMTLEDAFSIPARILKEVERLRTKQSVYVIKDESPLFKELKLERRHPKDVNPYLFATCTPVSQLDEDKCNYEGSKDSSCDGEKTSFSCRSLSTQDDTNTVQGTILIPCRTATRGSFPLNGTYFQINEVFADHESSISPIKVHLDWLWKRTTRNVYFGTSASPILKGISVLEVAKCFGKGYICVRAFNRRTRRPQPLHERFHISTVKTTKKEKKKSEQKEDE